MPSVGRGGGLGGMDGKMMVERNGNHGTGVSHVITTSNNNNNNVHSNDNINNDTTVITIGILITAMTCQ